MQSNKHILQDPYTSYAIVAGALAFNLRAGLRKLEAALYKAMRREGEGDPPPSLKSKRSGLKCEGGGGRP